MAVTVRDVAREAGVALGTVSRYLNGAQLREENRVKVEQAIETLGFKEQVLAIAAVVGVVSSLFSTSILKELEAYLNKKRYNLIISDFDEDPEVLRQRLQFFKNRAVDGIILFPSTSGGEVIDILKEYRAANIPFVAVDEPIPGFDTDAVLINNADSSFRIVEHLIHHHHRKIAIINGRKRSYVAQERLRGYREALQTYGIPLNERWLKWGEFTTAGGYTAVKELLASGERPTAIYSTNYEMTLGAAFALNELGVKLPEEMSFVGFDHLLSVDLIKPPLTVIEQPIKAIGQTVGRLMMKRIHGDYADFPQQINLKTRMLLRDSVRDLENR